MIGVFDSGIGGLTAAFTLSRLLPRTDIVYFGDTAHMPYGTRSEKTLICYAEDALRFLSSCGAERILAACGTVSSVVLPHIGKKSRIPLYGVVNPAAEAAADGKRILVLGTSATVRSHTFREAVTKRSPAAEVRELACPLFVAMAENGFTDIRRRSVILTVQDVLQPMADFSPDTVILGCTHFSLLSDAIRTVFPAARLIDSGAVAAYRMASTVRDGKENGNFTCYVSDGAAEFAEHAATMFGKQLGVAVREINLPCGDRYIKSADNK